MKKLLLILFSLSTIAAFGMQEPRGVKRTADELEVIVDESTRSFSQEQLEKQADLNAQLHYGAEKGLYEHVTNAIKQGADVNRPLISQGGRTALMAAAENGHAKIIQLLLKHHALVDQEDDQNHTALFYAKDNLETIKMLLNEGANANIRFDDHNDPEENFFYNANPELLKLLVAKGANINARHANGLSAIHQAVIDGNEARIELLLKLGAHFDALDLMQDELEFLKDEGIWAEDAGIHFFRTCIKYSTDKETLAKTMLSYIDSHVIEHGHDLLDDNQSSIQGWSSILTMLDMKKVLIQALPLKDQILHSQGPIRDALCKRIIPNDALQIQLFRLIMIERDLVPIIDRAYNAWITESFEQDELDIETFADFVKAGIPTNSTDATGKTLLWHCAERGYKKRTQALLKFQGIDTNPKNWVTGRSLIQTLESHPDRAEIVQIIKAHSR